MANASWQAKPIENIEIVINGLTKRVSRYNSKLYNELVDFLNEGRAVKNLDLPDHSKGERCRERENIMKWKLIIVR